MALKENWVSGEQYTAADANAVAAAVNTTPAVVIVVTGAEERLDALVNLFIDTREAGTRPDNMNDTTDLWFTPNSASVDSEAPSVPTGLASTDVTDTTITMGWSASTDNVAVTGYQIRVDAGTPVNEATLSHEFTGLTADTEYDFEVRARDAAGNWSDWSSVVPVSTESDVTVPAPYSAFDFHEGTGSATTSTVSAHTMTATNPGSAWDGTTAAGEFTGKIGLAGAPEMLDNWTIEFDIRKLTSLPGSETAFAAASGSKFWNILTDGKIKFYHASGDATSTNSISTDTTYKVVTVFTPSGWKLFINGVLWTSGAQALQLDTDVLVKPLFDSPAATRAYVVKLWKVALSDGEVAAL